MTVRSTFLLLLLCTLTVTQPAKLRAWGYEDWEQNSDCSCEPTQVALGSYLWLPTYDGEMMLKGNQVTLDVSLVDLIDQSDSIGVLVAHQDVRKGRWGAFFDFQYAKLGFDGQKTPLPNLTLDIDFRLLVAELAVYYELTQTGFGGYCTTWDIYGGGRFSRYDMSLVFSNSGNKIIASIDWFDPIVGLRSVTDLGCDWELFFQGDAGGFGLGSDFTWHAAGGLRYQFCFCGSSLSTLFLYRAISQDYQTGSSTGGSAFDVLAHGPLIGIAWSF